jgi:hypothetical protein
MNTQNPDLAMPADLDDKGQKAHQIIVEYLTTNKLATTELRAFYSPSAWRDRGEEYGCDSHLVIMYDGATSLKRVFSMDACYESGRAEGYKHYEAMQEKLAEAGLFFEECTRWYCAIYTI